MASMASAWTRSRPRPACPDGLQPLRRQGHLFAEAVRALCEQGIPTRLFEDGQDAPLRERLTRIGLAFARDHDPGRSPGTASCARRGSPPATCRRSVLEAGPQRVQSSFTALLERRIARGNSTSRIRRAPTAVLHPAQGRPHAQAVFGYCCGQPRVRGACRRRRRAVLRAYGTDPAHRAQQPMTTRRSALRCQNGGDFRHCVPTVLPVNSPPSATRADRWC